ncbi:peptide deformylase [Candidatus Methylospira mobilis]|uniref:Peptide deformylase n=1 Tax=Candidatus Methylospira mobilis TaxID=1808979 RepID=A0A5Q0BF89_9GAMM|nr:peptide deformylase [Candidatus Methylospira mobilis]QFY42490.1 peptide deformylase [Candidatus Methylospira mobilis]
MTYTALKLKITQVGDPVLRRQARTLNREEIRNDATQALIEQMRETMLDAPGVGLAAPQIGLALQLAVIEDREEYLKDLSHEELAERARLPIPFHVIINPQIISSSPETEIFYEGCLSLPGFSSKVERNRSIQVSCLDHQGETRLIEASGWYARILQHEIDHLCGNLYIDRMDTRFFTTQANYVRHYK